MCGDNKSLFDRVRQLCMVTGVGIDTIAEECNINQDLVAKLYMETMGSILNRMEEGENEKMDILS